MADRHPMIETALDYTDQVVQFLMGWGTSPAAWTQFGLLVVSVILAWIADRRLRPVVTRLLTPEDANKTPLARLRRFLALFIPLLLPLLAYLFTAVGEGITRSLFDSGAVIALGKRLFILYAVRMVVRDIVYDPFLKVLGRYVLLPVAVLYAVGLLDPVAVWLGETGIAIGNINLNLLTVIRGIIFGSVLFWLGQWSNQRGGSYIREQTDMRPPTRELASKALELAIFGVCFLLLMNILGLNLSALALLGGAVGVGLGFGLQKIASNFISGIILLLEGQATVGDFVELDGGESGTIIKMMSRATILETFDGKWIVVPNEDFITTRIVNWSDAGSGNRLEAEFSVSYDTDINKVPDIIEAAVATHPGVIMTPEKPDCELRGFGDSGIDFAVEFWVEGMDDGKNKYTSDVLFLIWNALKDNGIEIPYPHRVVEIKGSMPEIPKKKAAKPS